MRDGMNELINYLSRMKSWRLKIFNILPNMQWWICCLKLKLRNYED